MPVCFAAMFVPVPGISVKVSLVVINVLLGLLSLVGTGRRIDEPRTSLVEEQDQGWQPARGARGIMGRCH